MTPVTNVRKGSPDKLIEQLQSEMEGLRRKLQKMPDVEVVRGNNGESELSIKSGGARTRVSLNTDDRSQTQKLQKDLDAKGKSIKNVKSIQAEEGHFSESSVYIGGMHLTTIGGELKINGQHIVAVPSLGEEGQVLRRNKKGWKFEDEVPPGGTVKK
jgi:hypothetical protein